MKQLVDKYAEKLALAGFAERGAPLVGGLDAELVWNRHDPLCSELEKVLSGLNINSLLFSEPAEPYRTIIDYITCHSKESVYPNDCETRTFMHDLPVVREFKATQIIGALKQRKSVIIPGHGIVTWGTVSPEQAFIFFSSVCFACFVKFFCDFLTVKKAGSVPVEFQNVFNSVVDQIEGFPEEPPELMQGPFKSEAEVYRAICQVGRMTVDYHLVDSFFGNVSFLYNNTLYISQTTSSLDELEGCIDPCPLDGSSCAGITASSELTAHREIVLGTGINGVLHGHPKFSVIISMDCDRESCEFEGQCHIKCPEKRFIEDIPIVPGEVGTGPFGLCNTLPPAMKEKRGVIVYGHGLFTVARDDFNEAFADLLNIERLCMETYFKRIRV